MGKSIKILQINTFYKSGSTGMIMFDLQQTMISQGIDAYVAYGFKYNQIIDKDKHLYCIENHLQLFMSKVWSKLIGHHGFNNTFETKRLIRWIDDVQPDLIHMHNIHNYYLNISVLLKYIAYKGIPCILTMHDCWTFTGHCTYFDYSGCIKWKTSCNHCPSLHEYPSTYAIVDPSNWCYKRKKELFKGLNITFVTPSAWLKNLQQQSFLKNNPCYVINNGIDISKFHPIKSDVRQYYGIGDKKMILAVSAGLSLRKGRKYLLELPNYLNDNEVMVLVGLKPQQMREFPRTNNFIPLQRTKTAEELIGLYSEADVFINPTLEDNFPTTNLEALACGTPIVTFDTGGSGEAVDDKTGIVVPKGDLKALLKATREILSKGKNAYKNNCIERARTHYNKDIQYLKYIELYKSLLSRYNYGE